MSLTTTLKVTRSIALGTASLCTAALILVAGITYVLGTVAVAIALAAHDQAGYSPLLSGAAVIQPQLLLPPAPSKPALTPPTYESPIITPAPVPTLFLPTPTLVPSPVRTTARSLSTVPAPAPVPPTALSTATVPQLKALAKQHGGVEGVNRMRKAQLISHLENLGVTTLKG